MRRTMTRPARTVGVLGLAAVVGATLAGCGVGGGDSSYRYVASLDRSLVVKVPQTWQEVSPESVGFTSTSDQWRAYYDGSGKADPGNFVSTDSPVTTPSAPVVKMASIKIPKGTDVSDQELADSLLPTSEKGVVKLAKQAWLQDVTLKFAPIDTKTVDTATSHGVRTTTAFQVDDQIVIVEKLAVIDKERTHVHLIQAWCTQACYQANEKQIDQVFASFTVKEL